MAFTFDDYRSLNRLLSTVREKLAALTTKLESTLRVEQEDYMTLNFSQLGQLHYRGDSAKDILIDDAKQLFRYIYVMEFVARSPENPPVREIGELRRSLRHIMDAMNLMFRKHHIEQIQGTTDSEDMEEHINEETLHWLECTRVLKPRHMYPVRNYVIAKSLSNWLDAFQRDLGYLTEQQSSITFEESEMFYAEEGSVYCMAITDQESVEPVDDQ